MEAGRAADDYVMALEQLYALVDYITINISSPNTARLRELQGHAALNELVQQVVARRNTLPVHKPLLIKIAPDLTPSELDDVIDVCVGQQVDGIIATNTTIGRPATLRSVASAESGGLSGRPLRDRATDIVRYLWMSTGGTLPIIGVGGVFTAADVWSKLAAGAQLVQVYTGFVYEGPLMARRINRELVGLIEQHGISSLSEIIGKG
jgi:dihydroorotate dehydrogenase